MSTLRFAAMLFWCLLWDACYHLLFRPSRYLCNYCYRMTIRIEAEEVIAILSRPAKGD